MVQSAEGLAYHIRYLLAHPDVAQRLGRFGQEHVRHNFLITRHLRRYLHLMIALEHPGERIITIS